MDTYEVEVARIVDETPKDRTFLLSLVEPDESFAHRPGQYVLVTDPDAPDGAPCGFTISSAPREDGTFEITVRNAGRCGNQLHGYEQGKRLRVTAPAGQFVLDVESGRRLMLIAAGSGVTPFRAYVQHLMATGHDGPCCLLQSARSVDDLLFREELQAVSDAADWFTYRPTVTGDADSEWDGARERINEIVLKESLPHPDETVVYACGPTAFVDAMLERAKKLGVPETALRRETWG